MKKRYLSKFFAMTLAVVMLVGILPMNAFAGFYDDSNGGSDYYNVISEKIWNLAPGIQENEIVLNNDAGTRRQVLHTAVVDVNNPYVKVIPGTKGMWPQEGNYGVQSTSVQALEAEKLGYGNVVVATNCSLSWYTEAYYKQNPHLIGEPLGYSILNGEYYANSRITNGTLATGGVKTVVVINYDFHPLTGEPRPADMPKTWIRSVTDPLTGWEEQAIPVLFDFLVKPDANGNPVNQYKENHASDIASRTFVGVKADGTLVIAVSDGEQAPYSTGFTPYEMADYMIKMGCIIAANCDGGGSTTFCSQRPGEDLKVNCSLSDGGERPTSNTILVISTAPADGMFAQATLSTDYDFYTPGASVPFNALGTDAVGTKVEIPSDVEWTVKESDMGTVENGIFTSNGTEGKVTVQMLYDGRVVGERAITIATPDKLFFEQPVVTVPFGKTVKIPVKATASIDGVDFEIGLSDNDVTFTTTNASLGSFEGLSFNAVTEALAPADVTSTVTATLNMGTNPSATVQLNLGKGSEILWDFEGGQADVDIWNVVNNRKNAAHWDYYLNLSLADRATGQVHDGDYSLRLETNGLSSKDSHSEQYAWIRLGVDGDAIVLENARSVGFWLYVPEDNIQCWVQGHYKTDSDGDGVFDTDNVVSMMESENVYYNIDESGWHYLSMDISAFKKVALAADKKYDVDPADGMKGETGEFFLAIVFHKAINNMLWATNGSINGNYTYYLDNFTVDYSDAVDDRENPVFDKVYANNTALVKRDVVTLKDQLVSLSVAVSDQTTRLDANKNEVPLYNATGLDAASAKAYIDGVAVDCSFDGSQITVDPMALADGYHRVKFEICDKAGNKSVVIRVIKVESGAESSTIHLIPDDPTLDRIPFGSIYWMNLEATNIETVQSVTAVIDLNNVNHWQLDHMYLADGFSATYTIAEETNTATVTITRTGDNTQTGAATLAKLPVRMLYFDTDIKTPGYTAQTYWTSYSFWAQDLKMDVDMGLITHVDGKTSTFSNEEFHVDSEMYTSMANMDKAYFTAHGTTHVHTPEAMADQAPTCTQPGYTGRTFCAGCNSVVEWGSTIPATGHTYTVDTANRALVCACGHEFKGTGLQIVDGKTYYTVAGTLTSGWFGIDDDWYYLDPKTYAGVDGLQVADKSVAFVFENGRLTKGEWQETEKGMRYWYGPGYYRDTSSDMYSNKPYEIDGKTYLFSQRGYMQTGIVYFYTGVFNGVTSEKLYYDCGEDGVAVLLTGPFNDYYYEEGTMLKAYQLVENNGDFYFISDAHRIAKDQQVYLTARFVEGKTLPDGTPLTVGYYYFGADGKMVIEEIPEAPDTTVKHGVVDGYLYVDGVKQLAYKLVEFEGSFYFISDGNKIAVDQEVYLSEKFVAGLTFADGTPITPDTYYFDTEGKLTVIQDDEPETKPDTDTPDTPVQPEPEVKHGVVDGFLYINGEKQRAYKLVAFEGDFYFVSDGHKLAMDQKVYLSEKYVEGMTFADGTPIAVGYYYFDAEGKLTVIQDDETETETPDTPVEPDPTVKHGVVDGFLYVNGVKQRADKLMEFKGSLYFINDGNKIAVDQKVYLSETFVKGMTFADGTPIPAGYYTFDAEGKMIQPGAENPDAPVEPDPDARNGVINGFLYINDEKQRAYQLIEFEGSLYFVSDGNKVAMDQTVFLSAKFVEGKTFADGTPIPAGYYTFDAEGKMLPPADKPETPDTPAVPDTPVEPAPEARNGVINGFLYINDVKQRAYQLIEFEGNFYFVSDGHQVAMNKKVYLGEQYTAGLIFENGDPVLPGYYEFDAEGKMIVD